MGFWPILPSFYQECFLICPCYKTLCSSWVNEVAENAEKRSMEAVPWRATGQCGLRRGGKRSRRLLCRHWIYDLCKIWGYQPAKHPLKSLVGRSKSDDNALLSKIQAKVTIGKNPFSPYWPSGVIRIGLPSMKVKKFETFQNKRGSTCCKWPNLNAPGTQTPLHHPIPELTKPNLT